MDAVKQCGFCQRIGFPILPVRPAVVYKSDGLPQLSENVPMPITAEGMAEYSARILRNGFLYVYSEKHASWDEYYVTMGGDLYLLPEGGEVPDCIATGDKKPCVNNPKDIAKASLITLYLLPNNQENGIFWFGWSETPWTGKIKAKHADNPDVRKRTMVSFNLDNWISSQKSDGVEKLSNLQSKVAEYSENSKKCKVKEYTNYEWIVKDRIHSENILSVAKENYPGEGAILFLNDPTAIVRDVNTLNDYLYKVNICENEKYKRGFSLNNTLNSLEYGIKENHIETSVSLYCKTEKKIEDLQKSESNNPYNFFPSSYDAVYKSLDKEYNYDKIKKDSELAWKKYEKYIDKNERNKFIEEFTLCTKEYEEKFMNPMNNMSLLWLNSNLIKDYYELNFDDEELEYGLVYSQSVLDVMTAISNKEFLNGFLEDKLLDPILSTSNYILNAFTLNNSKLRDAISVELKTSSEIGDGKKEDGKKDSGFKYDDISWDKLADVAASLIKENKPFIEKLFDGMLAASSRILTKIFSSITNHAPIPLVTLISSFQGTAVLSRAITGTRTQFAHAAINELNALVRINNSEQSKIFSEINAETFLKRVHLEGDTPPHQQTSTYLIFIDVDKAKELRNTTNAGRGKRVTETLTSEREIREKIFSHGRERLEKTFDFSSKQKARVRSDIVTGAHCGFSVFSLIWQSGSIMKTINDGKYKENSEAVIKFAADVMGVVGGLADLINIILTSFKSLNIARFSIHMRNVLGRIIYRRFMKILDIFSKIGTIFGLVTGIFDAIKGKEELSKENYLLGTLYFFSAGFSIAMVIVALANLGPIGALISLLLLLGYVIVNIFISNNELNEVEKWISRTLWAADSETISKDVGARSQKIEPKWPNMETESESFEKIFAQ
ncbi:T6SS effector BTH_I2691 family protein [Xenorhabdus entomophaga]|uniref:T6SS effector BTH_I2691 family protein n=1 Tax=Xenorhabdus entomophaga TaxID=3136257 RepID=UPI0030F468DC